jgi:hypothetical protein
MTMQQQIATQVRQSMAEPRPAVLAYLAEPWSHYGRHAHGPALGRHPELGLPALFGIVLKPLPARHLRAIHGSKTGMSARILTATEAATKLADAIQDAVLVPFGARYERTISWLQLAVRLPASAAPLLFEVGVRAALLAAIDAQPVEHGNAA